MRGKGNNKSNKEKKMKHHWINLNYNALLPKRVFDLHENGDNP